MKVELDGILLNDTRAQADGGILEGRSISSISASDGRNMVMLSVPGMEGSVFQDLGRTAVRVSFEGVISGKNAKSVVEMIRAKFKQGTPVGFNSDVSGAADITKVMIEDFRVVDVAGNKGRYGYSLTLKEYIEPPPQPSPPPGQDGEAEAWAENAAAAAEGSVNVVSGKVLDAENKPKAGVTVRVAGPDGEYTLTTGDDGIYRTEQLPPGEYEVTTDSEGYENLKHRVTIGQRNAAQPEAAPESESAEAQQEEGGQAQGSEGSDRENIQRDSGGQGEEGEQAQGSESSSRENIQRDTANAQGQGEGQEGPAQVSGDIPPPGEKAEEPEPEPVKAAPEKPKKKSRRRQEG